MSHTVTPVPNLSDLGPADLAASLDPDVMRRELVEKLYCMQAKFPGVSTMHDHYQALAYVIRDRLMMRWVLSASTYLEKRSRTVAYMSAEYLLGPQLGQAILALGCEEAVRKALSQVGLELEPLLEYEGEPALGNGGLGRLAACYMDSLATLDIPAIGYGIRYEFGIFEQAIEHGGQRERTDKWLRLGWPWAVARPEINFTVGFGGQTLHEVDRNGRYRVRWVPARIVLGTPHDVPAPGYRTSTTNFFRFWQAVAPESFDFQAFNVGDYLSSVHAKIVSENITKVLYPNDESPQGKQLRLEQQFFFVSCSLQDMIRLYRQRMPSMDNFHEKFAVQMNDTHPAIAVAELMRLLIDMHHMDWDQAWSITTKTCAYTNHTLMPEALETWPLELFARTLPRHLEIIYEINRRFLDEVARKFPGDEARLARMSLIDERDGKRVRMAHLATVGSHTVNGVAALHSRLLGESVLRDFAELWPEKLTNVTNGVTPRRFVRLANPKLSALLDEAVGPEWVKHLDLLQGLERFADDASFRERWRAAKRANKDRLAQVLFDKGLDLDPARLLDVQVKRIHEYKRQHLNLLHVVAQYARILDGQPPAMPRTILLGGKAAPGYAMAKLVIRLAHAISTTLEADPAVRRWLRVVFVPNFNVKQGELVYPAADLSEQISTAGMEASGTGNMKLSLNGALTIGTLDGANVEIREAVGAEHFILFGLTAEEIAQRKAGGYMPREVLASDAELTRALTLIRSGHFAPREPDLFEPLVASLAGRDPFFVLADFRAYAAAHDEVAQRWADVDGWTRSSILNVARMGGFSSDRAIADYAKRIWKVDAVDVDAPHGAR
ncbi:MAG: glycogen/starch/alpha-glucan phosphorylase [Myxococcota bacterium]